MSWISCPACGLKHSARPDGLCPRCRATTGAPAGFAAASSVPPAAYPAGPAAQGPLPTSDWSAPPPGAAERPGTEVTAGNLVSRTFSTWWANVWKFAGAILLAYVPLVLAGAAAAVIAPRAQAAGTDGFGPLVPVFVLGGLATLVLFLAQFGGVTYAAIQHLAGKRTGFGAMWAFGFRRAWPLLLAGIVAGLLILLGFVALIVPGIIVAIALSLVYPVVIAEDPGISAAIRRSFTLTRGSRWTLFGALLVVSLAIWAVSMLGNLGSVLASSSPMMGVVFLIFGFALQVAMAPLTTVLAAVAYHDLRVAKEGVDTSELSRIFE